MSVAKKGEMPTPPHTCDPKLYTFHKAWMRSIHGKLIGRSTLASSGVLTPISRVISYNPRHPFLNL